VRLAPGYAPLYRSWAQAEDQAGNYAAARQVFEDGLRADPAHAQLYHAWARMEARLCNLEALARLDEHARRHFRSGADAAREAEEAVDADMNAATPAPVPCHPCRVCGGV